MSETPVRVRFAPSPNRQASRGRRRTAIYNWAFARANHGTFILRIDDTDPERSTEENTQIILRAMRWLGLDWDEGPEVGGDFGPYKQTERAEMYRAAAQRLWDEGKAYPCFCRPSSWPPIARPPARARTPSRATSAAVATSPARRRRRASTRASPTSCVIKVPRTAATSWCATRSMAT